MDYNTLLDMVAELGYRLAMCGAETFRVEESANRILASYGIASEAFSIPNCLIVSIETDTGKPMTRMRRIGHHDNDMDGVEKFSALSRRICAETPEPAVAMQWIRETVHTVKRYKLPMILLGNFLGAFGFSFFYSASFMDALCAGACGILGGLMITFMDRMKVNQFFRTIAAAFTMALLAYFFSFIGLSTNADASIIGALMLLVPGLVFTNAMRDIIYGDTNSGINRIVQVLLVAAAIALGTGVAWSLSCSVWSAPPTPEKFTYSLWFECIACLIGCAGFCIAFNVHGPGSVLCAAGGIIAWLVFRLTTHFGGSELSAYFWSTAIASLYAEIMARIRKYPAISYLVVSTFPLLPGAGIYYTMSYAVRGDMEHFAQQGGYTAAIAGIMAVGILLSSTLVRLSTSWKLHRKK